MNNVAAYVQNANPIPADQPWDSGFGENSLLRTIGMIILVVVGVFQIVACLFEIFNECFGDQVDDRRIQYQHPIGAQPNPEPVIQLQFDPLPQDQPIAGADRAILLHVNKAADKEQADKLQEAVKGCTINQKKLSATPPAVTALLEVLKRDVSKIEVDELLTIWDASFGLKGIDEALAAYLKKIYPNYERDSNWNQYFHLTAAYNKLCEQNKAHAAVIRQRSFLDTRYVKFIKQRDGQSADYYDRLQLLAKNIILELRKESVSPQKRQTVLLCLEDAAEHCEPRRLEESRTQLLNLIGAQLAINDKFLLWAQQIKEAIIIKEFQQGQFHVINRARNLVGEKWGLDRDPLNLGDRHRDGCGGGATKEQYEQRLTAFYTPEHLIQEIYGRLVYDGDVKGAMDFLKNDPEVQESILMNDGVYFEVIKDPLGQDISLVTRKGVAKIAAMVGLITPPKRGFFSRLFG